MVDKLVSALITTLDRHHELAKMAMDNAMAVSEDAREVKRIERDTRTMEARLTDLRNAEAEVRRGMGFQPAAQAEPDRSPRGRMAQDIPEVGENGTIHIDTSPN